MALDTFFFFFLLLSFRQLSCGSFHTSQFSFCTGTICPDLEVAALSLSEFYFWIIGYLEFFFFPFFLSFHSTSARLAARLTAGSPKCFFFLSSSCTISRDLRVITLPIYKSNIRSDSERTKVLRAPLAPACT